MTSAFGTMQALDLNYPVFQHRSYMPSGLCAKSETLSACLPANVLSLKERSPNSQTMVPVLHNMIFLFVNLSDLQNNESKNLNNLFSINVEVNALINR